MARRRSRLAADNGSDDESRALPATMRERNRAVAEREASRLARPERKVVSTLSHASREKSAVTSTPFGYHAKTAASEATKDEETEWCGPFSVARQMIAKREEARRQREEDQEKDEAHHPLDDVMMQVDLEQKRKAHPSLQWRAKFSDDHNASDNLYSKRQKRHQAQSRDLDKTPTLFKLCLDFVVKNFEYVEALGNVDSSIRSALCKELVAKNKMNPAAFEAIAEAGIETLELIDCSEISQEQMTSSLQCLIPAGLRFLLLNHAGRCFGPKAVKAIVSDSAERPMLYAVSVGGAYLLKDSDAASLITSIASSLSSIEFKACPLIGSHFCKSLNQSFSSPNNNCLLELNLEDMVLTKDSLLEICSSDALRNLKSLGLRQIGAMDDEVVLKLLDAVGDNLEGIDLSDNYSLTDEILSGIRRCNKSGALHSLQLCGLKNLTAAGLEALFTQGIPGLPTPPMLRTLHLTGCSYDAVTDQVVDLVTRASSGKHNDAGAQIRSMSSLGGLVNVSINGASCTDKALEYLAATSASSLKETDVSFCPNVTDQGLGYLVSKAGQLTKLHVWGCAQLTDDFLDGHSRVGDARFDIVGAWMKKAGARSLR